jgi:phenylalanyl-tRNA synthetase beta subunit
MPSTAPACKTESSSAFYTKSIIKASNTHGIDSTAPSSSVTGVDDSVVVVILKRLTEDLHGLFEADSVDLVADVRRQVLVA